MTLGGHFVLLVAVTTAVYQSPPVSGHDDRSTAETAKQAPLDKCDYMIIAPATAWKGSSLRISVRVSPKRGDAVWEDGACRGEAILKTTVQERTWWNRRTWRPQQPTVIGEIGIENMEIDKERTFDMKVSTSVSTRSNDVRLSVSMVCVSSPHVLTLGSGQIHSIADQRMCHFNDSTVISLQHRTLSSDIIMIELDKPIYKPGQTVKGRILAMTNTLLPIEALIPHVHITDASGARVAQWKDVELIRGIGNFSLHLSTEPYFGDWVVAIPGFRNLQRISQKFEVKKYVLPKFSVDIAAPKCITAMTRSICGTVQAKYTHGKSVKGKVRISFGVRPQHFWSWLSAYISSRIRENISLPLPSRSESGRARRWQTNRVKISSLPDIIEEHEITGEKEVCIPLEKFKLRLNNYYGDKFAVIDLLKFTSLPHYISWKAEINATVTETVTGTTRNHTQLISCFRRNPFQLQINSDDENFRPGMPLSFSVEVKHVDGNPVPDATVNITCSMQISGSSFWGNYRPFWRRVVKTGLNGAVKLSIEDISCSAKQISCNARLVHRFYTSAYKYFTALYSTSSSFLSLKKPRSPFKAGKNALFNYCFLTCQQNPSSTFRLNYFILSRGRIAASGDRLTSLEFSDLNVSRSCATTPTPTTSEATSMSTMDISGSGDERGTPFNATDSELLNGTETNSTAPTHKQIRRWIWYPPYYIGEIPPPPCPCECKRSCNLQLSFPVKSSMGPNGKLVVHITLPSGEVIVDSVDFSVSDIFDNKVKLQLQSKEVSPGRPTTLYLSADAGSRVAIAAVDKSLHLLGENNQITSDKVASSVSQRRLWHNWRLGNLRQCQSRQYPPNPYGFRMRGKRSSIGIGPYYPTTRYDDALDSWAKTGTTVMTSFKLDTKPCPKPVSYLRTAKYGEPMPLAADFDALSSPEAERGGVVRQRARVVGASGPSGPTGRSLNGAEGRPGSPPVVIATKRTFFPETWLFKTWDLSAGQTLDNLTVKVPDTITSWVASAYALSEESGFGIAKPKELTVFQPFFVSLKLPYSIVRGETLHLLASVFNYVPGCMQVTVHVKPSDCHSLTAGSDSSQELCLCSDEAKSAEFNLTFLELGNCPIVVEASTAGSVPCERDGEGPANVIAVDRVTRKLKVEAEGVEREQVQSALLVKRKQEKPYNKVFHIRVPNSIVRGSGRAWLTVVGDVMGPSLDGLDSLLRMPYGCGEQNMINFAPGISIARYLQSTRQLDSMRSAKDKAIDVIQSGYQRQNRYRHPNGAYSAFGPGGWNNKNGCLWLTSFVVKSFCKAKATGLVSIDESKACQSIHYIVQNSSPIRQDSPSQTGLCYFPNDNCVHSKSLQGGGKSDLAHTAYVCSALLETRRDGCQCHSGRVNSTIACCVRYLENKIDDINTTYAAAILCYTLTLAKSPQAEAVCRKLDKLQTKKGGQCYWQQVEQKPRKNCNWWWCHTYRPPAADIEITAYALQANVLRSDIGISEIICISKWLAEQRNSFGGYRSTQDTVVGLEALSQVAKLLYVPSEDGRALKLAYHYLPDMTSKVHRGVFRVDSTNKMVVMKRELRQIPGSLALRVRGSGSALIQISTRYNVRDPPPEPAFALSVAVQREKDSEEVTGLRVCTSWQLANPNSSNMALVMIELPSGYVADEEDLDKLKQSRELKLERFDVDGRKVFLYFDEITREKLCFMLTIKQDVIVENLQPTTVVIQDYYTPELEATIEYSLSKHYGVCSPNQTYDKCASACPQTCKDNLLGVLSLCKEPCQAGCRCMDNYAKHGDSCILTSDCMRLVNICGKNEEFRECASTCPLTCDNYLSRLPRLCPMVCRKGCDCQRGYVRDANGKCILTVECQGSR